MSVWQRSTAAVQSPFRMQGRLPNRAVPFASDYRLDSSVVDVTLARALFNNNEPRYKLGAGFARAAINVPTGFMGIPILKTDTEGESEAQDWLNRLLPQWSGSILAIHKATYIDGETLVRIRPANRSPAYAALFGPTDRDLELSYEPSESFEVIHAEEDMGAIAAFRVKHLFYVEEGGTTVEKYLWETITADSVKLEYQDGYRPTREFGNRLGFVPAVHIKNEAARHELRGRSELEPLEPYLKFYNDVMLHAGSASQLHSTAKLTVRVQDVERFLANNFTDAEIADGRLRFRDKDVLFFETGAPEIGVTGAAAYQEGADIIQAQAPLGDTNTLLEYIFLNIVDVSEVPEWAFGGAIASSKASVTEQSAPLIHKVNRKRSLFENEWALVGRMALKMLGFATRVEVSWDDLAQKDTKAEAEALKALADAVVALNDAGIMSKKAAVDHLRPYVKALLVYDTQDEETERARIDAEVDAIAESLVNQPPLEESDEDDEEDRQAGLRAVR